jgi:predicted phosphodiesterase
MKEKTHTKTKTNFEYMYGIPEGVNVDRKPYTLPKASKRILYISDLHAPYHDPAALQIALQYGIEKQADTVVINGDLMDCFSVSPHQTDPRKRDLAGEIRVARGILEAIRNAFPEALIIFKEGNHEDMWTRYLIRKAPELLDTDEFQLEVILKLRSLGIKYIKDKRYIQAGQLHVIHGHEYYGGVFIPVNIARGYMLKTKKNTLVAHHHRTSEHVEKAIDGSVDAAWSQGCLCQMNPDYMPYNQWNHGFAYQEIVDSRGNFRLENKKIIDGKLY